MELILIKLLKMTNHKTKKSNHLIGWIPLRWRKLLNLIKVKILKKTKICKLKNIATTAGTIVEAQAPAKSIIFR